MFGDVPPQLMALLAAPRDELPDCVDVYPENWLPLQVFMAMGTQWRVGMSGAVGLDYNVIPMMERRFKVEPDQSDDLFEALQVLEMEVLKIWSEQAGKKHGG